MNKFLEFSLIKILLLIFTSVFHFSVMAWEPSESNCKSDNLIEGLETEKRETRTTTSSTTTETVLTPLSKAKLEARRKDCERFYKEQEREREQEDEDREEEEKAVEDAEQAQLDFAKEQAEQAEKARDEALKKQQEMMDQAKNECISSYDQVIRQRERIESEVQRIQQQMDRIEDDITKNYASISESEDQAREEILKLKQEERQAINRFKQEQIGREQAGQERDRGLQTAIEEIENSLLESSDTLEDIADFEEQVCSSRSAEYLKISVGCYNEKLAQVTAEREELFAQIHTGRYEAVNVSQLFEMDAQNINQTFQRRLNALHAHCFQEKTGESLPPPGQSLTVQVSCDLQSLERRAQNCMKTNNNHRNCPKTPIAQEIEQQILAQLKKVDKDQKKIERAREQALKQIEKLKERHEENEGWAAKALAELEENFRMVKKDFKERHERARNRLLRVREKAENNILQLERNKIRLLASDPARHFEEQLIMARVSCCHSASPQQTAQQCTLLTRYEQDTARFQFAFARSMPALRSTSGPSSETNRTNTTTNNSGTQ